MPAMKSGIFTNIAFKLQLQKEYNHGAEEAKKSGRYCKNSKINAFKRNSPKGPQITHP